MNDLPPIFYPARTRISGRHFAALSAALAKRLFFSVKMFGSCFLVSASKSYIGNADFEAGSSVADNSINVQYGTGWIPAEGWLNFDSSPSIWLERLPLIGRFIRVNENRFPAEIAFGEIVARLPVSGGRSKAVYASHVLEHLSFDDFHRALDNTYSLLRPGGVFRLIVPDLEERARIYLRAKEQGNPLASIEFCCDTMLGVRTRPRGPLQVVRSMLGNSTHLWMWDEASIANALQKAGFVNVRRCEFGDAADPDFRAVEAIDRFVDQKLGIREIAVEAIHPPES